MTARIDSDRLLGIVIEREHRRALRSHIEERGTGYVIINCYGWGGPPPVINLLLTLSTLFLWLIIRVLIDVCVGHRRLLLQTTPDGPVTVTRL